MNTLPVSEVFGPTIQGEGPAAGRAAWFIRLGGCNLSCAWCDTPYTWDGSRYSLRSEITHTDVGDIVASIPRHALVVISGGEPLLQQDRHEWRGLLADLAAKGCQVHVETNGTIAPNLATLYGVNLFAVSPKLANAGRHRGHQNPALAPGWDVAYQAGLAHLKIVCRTEDDVTKAAALARTYGWPPHLTWVMPEGTTSDALATRWPVIAAAAAQHGINATHRLHVLAWADERGH